MALVMLVIQDQSDGTVNVQAFSEPALDPRVAIEPTRAQAALVVALNAVTEAARESAPRILTPH